MEQNLDMHRPELPPMAVDNRQVTILFADIAGFTTLAEQLSPETLLGLLHACFEDLGRIVTACGGSVDHHEGDRLMAVFGAPVALEHHAAAALSAALEFQSAMDDFNRTNAGWLPFPVRLHIGINSGQVVYGRLGVGPTTTLTVIGRPVNLAARLASQAAPGEILVGRATCYQVRDQFALQPISPWVVKGLSRPVSAYRLAGVCPPGARRGRLAPAPLVRREAEMSLLRHALAALRAGQGGVIFLSGEAGTGKTRLIQEARALLDSDLSFREAQSPLWLEGHPHCYLRQTTGWLFRELLTRFLHLTGDESPARVAAVVGHWLSTLSPSERTRVGDLLGPFVAALPVTTSSASQPDEIGSAMIKFFTALAARRPLVVVAEDLQWLDRCSAAWLENILRQTADAPILFLLAGREAGEWPARRRGLQALRPDHHLVCLSDLDRDDMACLLAHLLGQETLEPALSQTLLDQVGGNPYYLEEELQALIEVRALTRRNGLWHLDAAAWQRWTKEVGAVPARVWPVIAAHIAALEPAGRAVLERAAVIGRRFALAILGRMGLEEKTLNDGLRQLEAGGLIELDPQDEKGALVYHFRHNFTHKVAYETQSDAGRRRHHLAVAEAIEALYPDHLERWAVWLAHHYDRAGVWAKAESFRRMSGRPPASNPISQDPQKPAMANRVDTLVGIMVYS